MQASNVLTQCIRNQEHLTFNVDVKVTDTAEDKTYAPVTANDNHCNIEIGGTEIGEIKVTEYANNYFKGNKKIRELRGIKLINELENKLHAKMGSTVTIPITRSGKPRSCQRFKREVARTKERCNKKKSCPKGFTRMGEEDKCGKYFGLKQPNCTKYGSNVTIFTKKLGAQTLYWCITPMV